MCVCVFPLSIFALTKILFHFAEADDDDEETEGNFFAKDDEEEDDDNDDGDDDEEDDEVTFRKKANVFSDENKDWLKLAGQGELYDDDDDDDNDDDDDDDDEFDMGDEDDDEDEDGEGADGLMDVERKSRALDRKRKQDE